MRLTTKWMAPVCGMATMFLISGMSVADDSGWHSIQPNGEPLISVTQLKPILQTETVMSPGDQANGSNAVVESRKVRVFGYEVGGSYLAPLSATASPSDKVVVDTVKPNVVYARSVKSTDPASIRPSLNQTIVPSYVNPPATTIRYTTPPPTIRYAPIVAVPPVLVVEPKRNTTFKPVIPFTGVPNNYSVGQGMLGQPKLYMDQQPVRNFFRYLLP
ncbi:MAG: hypothetical protein ACKVH8_06680 [Pirellulales bacterium]